MPYIEINVTKGATDQQKAQMVEGITELMVKILGKNPASTQIVFKEYKTENWGIAGRSVKKLRANGETRHISKQ
jgi:4-oxalocrotonate tautomerase